MSEQPQWPSRGQKAPNFWDDDLKAYIDWIAESVPDLIATALAGDEVVAAAAAAAVTAAAEEINDRIDTVQVHGNVSGNLNLDPAKAFHVFNATGPTTIEIGDPPGNSFAFMAFTGAENVTIEGTDIEMVDEGWVSALYFSGEWHLTAAGSGGGGTVEPVNDPPSQPVSIATDPESDTILLTVVPGEFYAGHEGLVDGGAYVDYGTDLTINPAVLHPSVDFTPGSEHSGSVRAYNSLGQKSAARNWGPVEVDTMLLHDLILSMEPEVYVRLTEGSIQDYSRVPAVWTAYSFYGTAGVVPTNFSGPALTPGDTGSLVKAAGTKVQRTVDGLMTGANAITQMIVGGYPATGGSPGDGTGTGIYYGGSVIVPPGQSGTEVYQAHQPGGVHTWFSVWNPAGFGDNNIRRYIDGQTGAHSTIGGLGSAPLAAPAYPARLFMGGNENGGNSMGGYSAYTVIWKRALTESERIALATSAGTLGNPAGGTLT